MAHLKPHSPEWFEAVKKINPTQATMTKQVIDLAGTQDACSVCGDTPANDYEVVGRVFAEGIPATIRLCVTV